MTVISINFCFRASLSLVFLVNINHVKHLWRFYYVIIIKTKEEEMSTDRISRGIKTTLEFQSMRKYHRNKEAVKGTK